MGYFRTRNGEVLGFDTPTPTLKSILSEMPDGWHMTEPICYIPFNKTRGIKGILTEPFEDP